MIPFVKMHGLSNDYLFLDALTAQTKALATRPDLGALALAMSDRRKGVGADGLILLCEPTDQGRAKGAAIRMRIWNSDGGEAEMCGNGIRCAARLAVERGHVRGPKFGIETGAGLLGITIAGEGEQSRVTVDMGEPSFDLSVIGADATRLESAARECEHRVGGMDAVLVSVGNPHLVAFLKEPVGGFPLETRGPELERHAAFPHRINVHVVNAIEPGLGVMRSWERGVGLTPACGTGASAVIAAGVKTGRLAREATLRLPGGELQMRWDEKTSHVFKTGQTTFVFAGEWREAHEGAALH